MTAGVDMSLLFFIYGGRGWSSRAEKMWWVWRLYTRGWCLCNLAACPPPHASSGNRIFLGLPFFLGGGGAWMRSARITAAST